MFCFSVLNVFGTVYVSALLFAELLFEKVLSFSKLELKFGLYLNLGKMLLH